MPITIQKVYDRLYVAVFHVPIHLLIIVIIPFIVNRIKLITGFDEDRARRALDLLLRDRKNEFKELSNSLNISPTTSDWEIIILKFCLDFEDCFKTWTDNKEPEHNQIHKCMTMMRAISKDKKSVTEITHIENIAYNISKEFQEVYKRLR